MKKTPLNYAAENNSKEIRELLVSKGAEINAKNIIYQIMKVLFFIKIISNKSRKLSHYKTSLSNME